MNANRVNYADEVIGEFKSIRREVKRYGMGGYVRGQSPSGYGKKISTDYMIRFCDDPKKTLYRVYCVCYSNSGSLYIIRRGEKLYIKEHLLD